MNEWHRCDSCNRSIPRVAIDSTYYAVMRITLNGEAFELGTVCSWECLVAWMGEHPTSAPAYQVRID